MQIQFSLLFSLMIIDFVIPWERATLYSVPLKRKELLKHIIRDTRRPLIAWSKERQHPPTQTIASILVKRLFCKQEKRALWNRRVEYVNACTRVISFHARAPILTALQETVT